MQKDSYIEFHNQYYLESFPITTLYLERRYTTSFTFANNLEHNSGAAPPTFGKISPFRNARTILPEAQPLIFWW